MPSFFSRYVEEFRVADSLFAEAYEGVGDRRRSVLKKWIARLYLFWGRERVRSRTDIQHWDQGDMTRATTQPLAWTLFVLSPDFSSPAQLLAALLPALLAGVPRVLVVREENGALFPAELLVAMELAGQEGVLEMGGRDICGLVRTARSTRLPGRVCRLGSSSLDASLQELLPGNTLWMPGAVTRAGIWFDADRAWDRETLAWTLPDTVFSAGGDIPPDTSAPEMIPYAGTLTDFMNEGFDALYLPSPDASAGILCPRVFGPGQEGGWIWPDLAPSAFMHTTVCWERDLSAKEEKDYDCQ